MVFESWFDGEEAGAERSEEAFVSWSGEEIDVELLDIDRDVAECLCGVDEECGVGVFDDVADVGDGLECAGCVRGVDGGDEEGFGSEGVGDVMWVDEAVVWVGGDRGDLCVVSCGEF